MSHMNKYADWSEADLCDETVLEIGSMSILWSKFEFLCFNKGLCEENRLHKYDNVVKIISEKIDAKKIYGAMIAYLLKRYKNIDTINERLGLSDAGEVDLKPIFSKESCDNIDACIASLHISRRIRNNLIHGRKDEKELNDFLPLFGCVNNFLLSAIKAL